MMNHVELRKRLRHADAPEDVPLLPPEFTVLEPVLMRARHKATRARKRNRRIVLALAVAVPTLVAGWRGLSFHRPSVNQAPIPRDTATRVVMPEPRGNVTQVHLQGPSGTRVIWMLRRPT